MIEYSTPPKAVSGDLRHRGVVAKIKYQIWNEGKREPRDTRNQNVHKRSDLDPIDRGFIPTIQTQESQDHKGYIEGKIYEMINQI